MASFDSVAAFKFDLITREEAALVFMQREVTFQWRPTVIEVK